MKLVLAALVIALVMVAPASAVVLPPPDQALLDSAASWMVNHDVTVRCMADKEKNSPDSMGAWAYVSWFDNETIYADDDVCAGALAIAHHDSSVPLWQQALGALALTHESFHLRLNIGDRFNEATTECRAIRHVAYMIERLGGDPAVLMPYALADHFRQEVVFPEYAQENCAVPWYW